jgi:hypothetical protein
MTKKEIMQDIDNNWESPAMKHTLANQNVFKAYIELIIEQVVESVPTDNLCKWCEVDIENWKMRMLKDD